LSQKLKPSGPEAKTTNSGAPYAIFSAVTSFTPTRHPFTRAIASQKIPTTGATTGAVIG
jgi:hypothetical protein